MSTNDEIPKPPGPPQIRRSIHLHPWQWIGVPLLLLIPILALFGLFGESWDTADARISELAVAVRYPTRYRYNMLHSLELDVTNTTAVALDTVTIDVDTAYVSRFSSVLAIPDFEYPYVIELSDLAAGETRRVRIELQGKQYGRHSGLVRVSSGAADTARIRLSTFIFP